MVCGGENAKSFKVRVSKSEVVASALPLQEHWLPLSNLDLLLPPVDVGVFFCYDAAEGGFAAAVAALKKALAQALVAYYAFAGELVPNSEGEPELRCSNRGVDFLEAAADVELRELDLYNPDASVEGKLVPAKKHGVLAVQATELKCGGLVVACTFDHRVADAYSANMFLVSWAHMSQSKPLSPLLTPSFRRSVLNPRRPGIIDPSLHDMYVPVTALPPPPTNPKDAAAADHLISRIYHVKAEQLERLQTIAGGAAAAASGRKRPTKLESFSALLWKLVAAAAGDQCPDKLCKMGIVVDGRRRLSAADGDGGARSMKNYFGNVLSIPFGGKSLAELAEQPLSGIAGEVREFLAGAVTQEHFLGLIDWVEAHRPVPGLAKIYCRGSEDGPAFVVSSGQQFPVSEIDFGWGRPVFGSYHFPWGGDAGYVMPMPSPAGNGDWIVYMHLLKRQLDVVEKEAAHVFRPFSFDCLN